MFFRKVIDWVKARREVVLRAKNVQLAAANYCAERAAFYAPVDTGFLRLSVHVTDGPFGRSTPDGPDYSTRYTVVCDAAYAQPVEFGHVTSTGSWVQPQPFLRMAVHDTARAYPRIAQGVRYQSGVAHNRSVAAGSVPGIEDWGGGGKPLGVTF